MISTCLYIVSSRQINSLVLADIVVCTCLMVDPIRLKTRVWHILLIDAPADTSGFEEVDNGLDTTGDSGKRIGGHSVSASSSGSHIVRLECVRCVHAEYTSM